MFEARPARMIAVALASLFVLQSLAAAAGARQPEGGGSARNDLEPNDRYQDAVPISADKMVEGTLLTNPVGDIEDWYIIDAPYGKVINASLYMVDYNNNDPGEYNFHLELANYDSSYTMNRWDNVIGFQYWSGSTGSFYLRVVVNYTNPPFTLHTLPARYTLNVSFTDPLVYGGSPVTGNLSVHTSHAEELFQVNTPPGDDQVVRARLQSPNTGAFSISAYNVWPSDGGWYLRNSSQKKTPGVLQECKFSGLGGPWYFIASAMLGNGTYTLSTEYASQAPDSNNFPPNAVLIEDLNPHVGFCDQGVDWLDWWKIEAKAAKTISETYLTFSPGLYEAGSYFHLSVWDKNLAYLAGDWMPQQGGGAYARVPDITVGYDGPVYIAVRALSSGASTAIDFVPSRGWYKLNINLPNDPPVYSGGLPVVTFNEDTFDESLNLSLYVSDPDNDALTFSIVGSSYHTHPRINATTGQVNMTPDKDWSGTEKLRFKVTDDGPGNKWIEVNTTVVVQPVNDRPFLKSTLDDLFLNEDSEGRTPDISLLFGDVDDPPENLSFGIKVVSQDTHPPGANISLVWDGIRNLFRLGPARLQWGSRTLEVYCLDGHDGTQAATRFNLTITHRNHDPSRVEGTADPTVLEVREHEKNSQLSVAELFTDPDLPKDYANDSLNITVSGMQKLSAKIISGLLVIDTGTEQYVPGTVYEERLVLTAKDRFGRTATLNITARVVPVNDPPVIVSFAPEDPEVTVVEGGKVSFRVTATDNDTADINYAWYRDGIREPGRGGTGFTFQSDFNMGGSIHTVRVVVSDGYTEHDVEWNVTVSDQNRGPTGSIRSPVNYTKAKAGTFVTFIAEGKDDDSDNLTYIWRNAAGVELGRGQTFSTDKLPEGTQTIRLEITDGRLNATAECLVIIYKAKAPGPSGGGIIPGFTMVAAAAAAAIALFAVGLGRRKRT